MESGLDACLQRHQQKTRKLRCPVRPGIPNPFFFSYFLFALILSVYYLLSLLLPLFYTPTLCARLLTQIA